MEPESDFAEAGERAAGLNVHLHHLAYLHEVVRRGSLSRAAVALHVSQPALSQALAELERRLGVPLFERVGRRRHPTAAGEAVLRFAEEVLARAGALQHTLDAYRGGAAGPLTVGMIDAATLYVLPDVVRGFRAAHPAVDLKIAVSVSGDLLRRLRAFELDLAFVVGPVEEPDLWSVEVLREPLHLYRPAGNRGSPHEARWVLYPAGRRTRRIIDAALAAAGIQPVVALESDNPDVLRQMVALDLGWSVLPAAIAEREGAPGRIERGDLVAERPMYAVRRLASPRDPRVEAFMGMVTGNG